MADAAADATAAVAGPPLRRAYGPLWRAALALAAALVALFAVATLWSVLVGVGVWGVNIPFVWGFDLINYAWWIGVANGASLFAAILVLRRHDLRTAVNRFAEGVALVGVACAAVFPIVHLGRPWLFYWTFPYPATFGVWPQFRSTLTWDFWAITTHTIVTSLLWYVGLLPDLATLRDRARRRWAARAYAVAALGWRNDLQHWAYHQVAHRTVAVLVLPLILVMQSIVAFEFATTLVPGWHFTRLPLHFVATGLAQGLGVVMLVAGLLRDTLRLRGLIEDEDMDLLGKLVLAAALFTGYLYLDEALGTLLAEPLPQAAVLSRLTGPHGGVAVAAFVLAVLVPQILWLRPLRLSAFGAVVAGLAVNAGVWCDRFSLVVGGLETLYLPAMQGRYAPSLVEAGLLLGSAGLFAFLLLLFARYVPVIAMYEARHDEHEERT